jgi:EAL domain-containing protein (putative c-di-GMP-specific phosphodiesterase class I)
MKGFDLSIDDFGTGHSSLTHLHRVPFTELKIDKSFVTNMNKDDEAAAIVKTCIMLGHELKMKVVAEGVESEEVYKMLVELGCDIAQGFYIAHPMPSDELVPWEKSRVNSVTLQIRG